MKVREHHRIEERRGLVGKVVGTYGGEEFTAVEVLFPDGQRRLFWPADLEESEPDIVILRRAKTTRSLRLSAPGAPPRKASSRPPRDTIGKSSSRISRC